MAVGTGPNVRTPASPPAKARRPQQRRAKPRAAKAAAKLRHRPATNGKTARETSGYTVPARFFRQLVFSMRNGVLVITRDGRIAAHNAEACRIFGFKSTPTPTGRPVADVLKAHPDVVQMLLGAFDRQQLPNRAELRLRASSRVIGYTLSHITDERGRHTGVAIFFKDLTHVEQEEERERLRDRLAALGEMAAAIAHEVKNPLAGIEVMAGLLRRLVPDSPDAQSILTDIINEAKMANAIFFEALEFVRPIRLQVECAPIADVLKNAAAAAERKLPDRAVPVQFDLPKTMPKIQGDQHQLAQVFTNLLINAFEALNGNGEVTVTVREKTQDDDRAHPERGRPVRTVIIDVADNGRGVPPEIQERIFNAFFTTKSQGSGLGLAIVHKIVDAHFGTIDLKSTAGRGTRFRVTLPVSAPTLSSIGFIEGNGDHESHSDS